MPMQREHEYILEQSREEKIRSLGFVCYNLYVDGEISFPEMDGIICDIKQSLNRLSELRQNNMDENYLHSQETVLNQKLMELGCICYNLYVDSKLFNSTVLSLCSGITSISHQIADGASDISESEVGYDEENEPGVRERKNVTQSKLKVTCPDGMEPIPTNYKRCICGYRNKSEAVFCGKCGTKLS